MSFAVSGPVNPGYLVSKIIEAPHLAMQVGVVGLLDVVDEFDGAHRCPVRFRPRLDVRQRVEYDLGADAGIRTGVPERALTPAAVVQTERLQHPGRVRQGAHNLGKRLVEREIGHFGVLSVHRVEASTPAAVATTTARPIAICLIPSTAGRGTGRWVVSRWIATTTATARPPATRP